MFQIKITQEIWCSYINIRQKMDVKAKRMIRIHYIMVNLFLKTYLTFPDKFPPDNRVPMTDKPAIHQTWDYSWTIFPSLPSVR